MHQHDHSHSHAHAHSSVANLKFAFLLNLSFTVIEIAGGLWTNSVAILSDAVHDFGDSFSLGLAWYLHYLSQRVADARFTYGYRRFSSLGALVTGLVLVAGLGFVASEAIARLQNPDEVYAPGVVLLAVIGVLFNGAAAWRMRDGTSLNEQVVSWHLLEDTLGWAAVLVGGAAMAIWNVPIIDPILALAIAVFVLFNVVRNLRKVLLVFLQAAPHGFDVGAFNKELLSVPGVVDAHHTHTWTLDGERHIFSMHLVLAATSTREEIVATKRRVHELLRRHQFEHITVEIELEGESCAADGATSYEE